MGKTGSCGVKCVEQGPQKVHKVPVGSSALDLLRKGGPKGQKGRRGSMGRRGYKRAKNGSTWLNLRVGVAKSRHYMSKGVRSNGGTIG